MKGNKGEWSEPYVVIKLLSDGELKQGGVNLDGTEETSYKVLSVSRVEKVDQKVLTKTYQVHGDKVKVNVEGTMSEVPLEQLTSYVKPFFDEIIRIKGASELSAKAKDVLDNLQIESVKADSTTKSDLDVKIHDHYTASDHNLGFSIKSQLGSPSTLINASKDNTNFCYKLNGVITSEQIAVINQICTKQKVRDRLKALYDAGVSLEFVQVLGDHYNSNLLMIDRDISSILAEALLLHYSSLGSNLHEIVNMLKASNPMSYPQRSTGCFYAFKLKRFLSESALGMMPATEWSGIHDATGGYIIVKKDGNLISYHLLRKNLFENYLLENTKFDTPSTSRHGFGEVYENNGDYFINLNLQVRFKA